MQCARAVHATRKRISCNAQVHSMQSRPEAAVAPREKRATEREESSESEVCVPPALQPLR
eukprot:1228025-Rhodomonas_salina.1